MCKIVKLGQNYNSEYSLNRTRSWIANFQLYIGQNEQGYDSCVISNRMQTFLHFYSLFCKLKKFLWCTHEIFQSLTSLNFELMQRFMS